MLCGRCGPGREDEIPSKHVSALVTESQVEEPSQSAAQSAAGTKGACEALGHQQEGSSIPSRAAFWSLEAACKILLTDTGKSREDVQASLRTRAPREESLGSQRVICEEVEGKWSLLSKDRFPQVFCLTRKNERDDRLVAQLSESQTAAARWRTHHNKHPEKRPFHQQTEFQGSVQKQGRVYK